jgi:hypothetical protein
LAQDLNREFALQFRSELYDRSVTRNGHIAATDKRMSPRQTHNVLDCARSLFHWARQPQVNQLPSTFINPFTKEIVGEKPKKDPLRPIPLPWTRRAELVGLMDLWQLCQFAIPLVLPLRPEDYTGLLVSEVDFDQQVLHFGTRLAGRDFNKGRQSFQAPFPPELARLLRRCAAGRVAGPLLLRRAVWDGSGPSRLVASSPTEVEAHFEQALGTSPPDEIQADQDQKRLFRRLLRGLGCVDIHAERHERGGELGESQEVAGGLFIARGHAPVMFHGVDEPLDEISLLVLSFAVLPLSRTATQRWDDHFHFTLLEQVHEPIGIEGLVRNDRLRLVPAQKFFGSRDIGLLAWA